MSLVLIAADSAQAIAISDGRAFTGIEGQKKFLRDDMSKVFPLTPQLCIAATNVGITALFRATRDFVASYSGAQNPFEDVLQFAWTWFDADPQRLDMRATIFGWSERLKRMRVATGARSQGKFQFIEVFPPADHLPIFLAMGKAEESVKVPPEKLAVKGPIWNLYSALNSAAAREPDVGGSTFEYLLQAPEEWLRREAPANSGAPIDRCRCPAWPIFDAAEFRDALAANPPASMDTVEAHIVIRAAIYCGTHYPDKYAALMTQQGF